MPKVKTNSGAKKRFVLTGTGKIKRRHAYHSHILTKKTKKQKRNHRINMEVPQSFPSYPNKSNRMLSSQDQPITNPNRRR